MNKYVYTTIRTSKLFLRKLNYEKLTENRQKANDDAWWTIL